MEVFYTRLCFVRFFLVCAEWKLEDREVLEAETHSKRQRRQADCVEWK